VGVDRRAVVRDAALARRQRSQVSGKIEARTSSSDSALAIPFIRA